MNENHFRKLCRSSKLKLESEISNHKLLYYFDENSNEHIYYKITKLNIYRFTMYINDEKLYFSFSRNDFNKILWKIMNNNFNICIEYNISQNEFKKIITKQKQFTNIDFNKWLNDSILEKKKRLLQERLNNMELDFE